jgi:PAS domain S-box-containing protein
MDSTPSPADRNANPFPAGEGEMAVRVRGFDWAATAIGPLGEWPQSLKTAIELMLASPLPMVMLWGEAGVMIYNDGYALLAGPRHPVSLGSEVDEHWPEVAEFNRRVIDRVLGGENLSLEDEDIVLNGAGVAGDNRVSLTYVPLRDEAGQPIAVLGTVVERTDRRFAERRSKATEEQFQTLANSIPTLCWMADKTGWIFWYNQRWYDYGGVTPAEMEGWGWQSMHHPDMLPAVMERWSASIKSGEPFEMVFPLKAADGEYHPFLTRVIPVRDEDGAIVRWFGTNTDITQQRLAEELLRKSEEQFRTLAEAIPNHAWASEPNGMLNWFNRRVYEYTGATQGELDGEKWEKVVHPDDLPRAGAAWAKSLGDGSPYEIEFRLLRADGAYRWFLARAMPVRDDEGRIIRWIGTNTDIMKQREVEEAQRALNQTLEIRVAERTADRDRMWRLSQDMMIVLPDAPESVIQAVNPAWTRILGWTEAELVGQSAGNFVHPDDVSLVGAKRPFVEEVWGDGRTIRRYENRYRHKNGGWRWISWTVVSSDGLLQGVGRDITAEKERAAALAQAEAQLRQAQKMEAVGQLTGGIAHDFNNMLAIVISSLGLIKRRLAKGDANVERFADSALEGANRAASLTHRLLAFARQQPLKPEAIDAGRLVSGLAEMLARTLGASVQTETVLGRDLWRSHADPHQLESAILNLAVNARDAMPDGGKLTIETANASLDAVYAAQNPGMAPGQYVVIGVTDTGAGMDKEVVSKAFDPFFTTKEVGKGTGLGLSQVYGFVRQSGGHVKIYSEVGRGTTIMLYLPRYIGDQEAAAETLVRPKSLQATAATAILIVDDETAVRQVGREALIELGYRVFDADGAAAALRILDARDDITLLFTDIVMPGVDGRKLAEEAQRRRPDLKVLFTTGFTRSTIQRNGLLNPGFELLSKPFTIEQLGTKLRTILGA